MTKSITHELRYDGVSPDQVFAMVADPAFRELVCDNQQMVRKTVSITPDTPSGGMTVDIEQVQAADGVPGFVKKFVGSEIVITQHEAWSSRTSAKVEMAIPGKPGEMSGTVSIVGDDSGTTETVKMSVKVGIPLVGGKIEDFIGSMMVKALKVERRTGVKWLGR